MFHYDLVVRCTRAINGLVLPRQIWGEIDNLLTPDAWALALKKCVILKGPILEMVVYRCDDNDQIYLSAKGEMHFGEGPMPVDEFVDVYMDRYTLIVVPQGVTFSLQGVPGTYLFTHPSMN